LAIVPALGGDLITDVIGLAAMLPEPGLVINDGILTFFPDIVFANVHNCSKIASIL
jgi:hypothetical protein